MIFAEHLTTKERIDLLERSILVNAYCYYELDDNILSDRQYDMNALQLEELIINNPGAFRRSNYYKCFTDFAPGTGFDLVAKIKSDSALRSKIDQEARWALRLKSRKA